MFADVQTQAFIPTSTYRDLYAFSLIPRFTETTMVNFALASGLMKEALKLDKTPSIPITDRSIYTFAFYPRNSEGALDASFRPGRDRWSIHREAKRSGLPLYRGSKERQP